MRYFWTAAHTVRAWWFCGRNGLEHEWADAEGGGYVCETCGVPGELADA